MGKGSLKLAELYKTVSELEEKASLPISGHPTTTRLQGVVGILKNSKASPENQ